LIAGVARGNGSRRRRAECLVGACIGAGGPVYGMCLAGWINSVSGRRKFLLIAPPSTSQSFPGLQRQMPGAGDQLPGRATAGIWPTVSAADAQAHLSFRMQQMQLWRSTA